MISLIINMVIWVFSLVFHLFVTVAQLVWELALRLLPPLAAKFGESHEKNKRKMLIESVPSEKWGNCFNRLLEYRDICFGPNCADARSFDENVSVRYQMEQGIKEEFGMDIGKYMKGNEVDKLEALILDMEQYILGNIQPSKKYQKMNKEFSPKANTENKGHGSSDNYGTANYTRGNSASSSNYASLPTGYFADCKNKDEVQQRFNELNNTFNPNYGASPNPALYQTITQQYNQAMGILADR